MGARNAEELLTDGERIGWLGRGGLFVMSGDHVGFLATPPVVTWSAGPVWAVALEGGEQGGELWWGAPGEDWQRRELPAGRIRLGGALLAWRRGSRGGLQTLDGRPVAAPIGAINAWPWSEGVGASWWIDQNLYQLTERVSVVAVLPAPITAGVIGPQGAAVLEADGELLAVAPGGMPVPLAAAASLEGARLSTEQALLVVEDGVGLFCLKTGALLAMAGGELSPVGFTPQPCVLDEETGRIHRLTGECLAEGFLPGAVALHGERLYGPGGAAWSLVEATRLFTDPALSAAQLLITPAGLLCIGLEEAVVLDPLTGDERDRWPLPDVGEAWLDGEKLRLCGEDRTLVLDLAGNLLDEQPSEEPPEPDTEPPDDPLQPDGAAAVGGRHWLWSDDGLLVSRPHR